MQRLPLSISEQNMVVKHIQGGKDKFYLLVAVMVMPDHVHIILMPFKGSTLTKVMKGVKGVSSHKINLTRKNKNRNWQDESFDRIIRHRKELIEKVNYMFKNPIKAGLTVNPWEYHGWYYNENWEKELNELDINWPGNTNGLYLHIL